MLRLTSCLFVISLVATEFCFGQVQSPKQKSNEIETATEYVEHLKSLDSSTKNRSKLLFSDRFDDALLFYWARYSTTKSDDDFNKFVGLAEWITRAKLPSWFVKGLHSKQIEHSFFDLTAWHSETKKPLNAMLRNKVKVEDDVLIVQTKKGSRRLNLTELKIQRDGLANPMVVHLESGGFVAGFPVGTGFPTPFEIVCFDDMGTEVWRQKVWTGVLLVCMRSGFGVNNHHLEVIETVDGICFLGSLDFSAYIEVFSKVDGSPRLRFSTSYGVEIGTQKPK